MVQMKKRHGSLTWQGENAKAKETINAGITSACIGAWRDLGFFLY
jgi:hypothetical protein